MNCLYEVKSAVAQMLLGLQLSKGHVTLTYVFYKLQCFCSTSVRGMVKISIQECLVNVQTCSTPRLFRNMYVKPPNFKVLLLCL